MRVIHLIRSTFISVALVMLTACSMPAATATMPPTPNPNQVATQVAIMLTPTIVTSTPSSGATNSPTVENTGTATPIPTLSPTLTQTSTTTLTPTTTVTVTPQPTQTPLPGDPKTGLGDPTWSTSFPNGKAFGLDNGPVDDPEYHFEVRNGAMVMIGKKPDGFHAWRLTIQHVDNFYLEAAFQSGDCTGLDRYGLMFRAPDMETGYFFGVSCDGQFNLRNLASSGFSDIQKWTKNSAIQAGSNQTNRLGVMAKGDKISLYANGHLLGDFIDSSYSSGTFGYFIASINTNNLTVQSNNIAYWIIK